MWVSASLWTLMKSYSLPPSPSAFPITNTSFMGLSCTLPWEQHVNPICLSMKTDWHIPISMSLSYSIPWEPHVNPARSSMRSSPHIHIYGNPLLHCDLAPLTILPLWDLFRLPFGFQKSYVELHVGIHVFLQVLPIYIYVHKWKKLPLYWNLSKYSFTHALFFLSSFFQILRL